jgi:general secretion pathway protein A
MDLAYWGFRRWPFERTFAADRFFSSPVHEEALARLLFLVEESRRTGIVIGPGGTGKTYLLKLFQQKSERLGRLTVRCDATGLDGHELVSQIAVGCHVPCEPDAAPARVWSGLKTRFEAFTLVRQPLVVIIDHFDLVDFSCQQAICRLRQLADSTEMKMTIVIATRDRIIPSALQDIVELRIEIAPWTENETTRFIHSAVAQSGSSENLFTDEALSSVYQLTNGVPANVVLLCNFTLLAAMGQDETLITKQYVEAAANELPLRPVHSQVKPRMLSGQSVMMG